MVTTYYWFGGRRVAMRAGTTLNFLTADSLTSTTALLDTSGYVSQQEKYFPFGSTRSGSLGTDKQFTGQQVMGGLYMMGRRMYDPTLGRFLQPDSIIPDYKDPQALNRYSYVVNNPLRYRDPTAIVHWICVSATQLLGRRSRH